VFRNISKQYAIFNPFSVFNDSVKNRKSNTQTQTQRNTTQQGGVCVFLTISYMSSAFKPQFSFGRKSSSPPPLPPRRRSVAPPLPPKRRSVAPPLPPRKRSSIPPPVAPRRLSVKAPSLPPRPHRAPPHLPPPKTPAPARPRLTTPTKSNPSVEYAKLAPKQPYQVAEDLQDHDNILLSFFNSIEQTTPQKFSFDSMKLFGKTQELPPLLSSTDYQLLRDQFVTVVTETFNAVFRTHKLHIKTNQGICSTSELRNHLNATDIYNIFITAEVPRIKVLCYLFVIATMYIIDSIDPRHYEPIANAIFKVTGFIPKDYTVYQGQLLNKVGVRAASYETVLTKKLSAVENEPSPWEIDLANYSSRLEVVKYNLKLTLNKVYEMKYRDALLDDISPLLTGALETPQYPSLITLARYYRQFIEFHCRNLPTKARVLGKPNCPAPCSISQGRLARGCEYTTADCMYVTEIPAPLP
jgi:hypothetical protein